MSKCVLCFVEHNNQWTDGSNNMYCEQCVPIRKQARGTLSEILPNLYLSDVNAAAMFDGARMCVHEHHPGYKGYFHHVPILTQRPVSKHDRSGAVASIDQLNKAADIINTHMWLGNRLLVHCWGGIERSPLTVAWYLIKSKRCKDFQEAYAFIKAKRPVVSERLFWLPEHYELP